MKSGINDNDNRLASAAAAAKKIEKHGAKMNPGVMAKISA
jgi:hypothetical protein